VIINPDTHVFRGETVTFRCEIQGGGDTEWTYDWYKDDNTLNPKQTTQEFSISSVPDSSRGKYTCRGRRHSDNQISEMSDPVTFTVSEKPKPTVSVNPRSFIYTGDTVTLNCNLQSTGWSFSWYKDYWKSPEPQNTNPLSVIISNEGQTTYYCKALRGNYESEFSAEARIIVKARPKPVVKIHPAVNVFIGENVTLTCDIQTGGSWKYHWYRNNDEILDAAGTRTYRISNVKDSNKGAYRCKGTQSSEQKYTQSILCHFISTEKPKPTVSVNPRSFIYTGDTVTLNCNLQSTGWSFSWYKDYWKSPEPQNTNPLSVIISNEGQTTYYCKALRGNYESEFSAEARIIVKARPKPVVKIHPAVNMFIGENVTLTCDIQTGGSWKYHWYRNNDEILDAAGTRTYMISNVKASNKGAYSCKGTQSSEPKYTQSSDAVTLTVAGECVLYHILPKPVVIIKPDTHVFRGETVTFRCEIQGGGDTEWTYDWYKDDNTLNPKQTTQEFSISSVPDSSRGKYTCRGRRHSDNQISEMSDPVTFTVS
ncbi:Fc receptor-like protein 5, partial [Silurus meridionalis]